MRKNAIENIDVHLNKKVVETLPVILNETESLVCDVYMKPVSSLALTTVDKKPVQIQSMNETHNLSGMLLSLPNGITCFSDENKQTICVSMHDQPLGSSIKDVLRYYDSLTQTNVPMNIIESVDDPKIATPVKIVETEKKEKEEEGTKVHEMEHISVKELENESVIAILNENYKFECELPPQNVDKQDKQEKADLSMIIDGKK